MGTISSFSRQGNFLQEKSIIASFAMVIQSPFKTRLFLELYCSLFMNRAGVNEII